MTITIAIWGPDCVVLGADRLRRSFAELKPRDVREYGMVTKIGIHSRLAIGWANRGVATLGGKDLTDTVREAIESVPDGLWKHPLKGTTRVAQHIRPLIIQLRKELDPKYHDNARVEVAVGIGVTEPVRLEVMIDAFKVTAAHPNMLHPPESLAGFFESGKYSTDQARFGTVTETCGATVDRVVSLLRAAIDQEAKISSDNLHIGYGGQVVVVTTTSATVAAEFSA